MKITTRMAASTFVVVGSFLAPAAALAGSYDGNTAYCSDNSTTIGSAMNGVEAAIGAATFKATRDQTNLYSKLFNANAKTTEGKMGDAIAKLDDISSAATALAGAAKPKLDSADGINAAVLTAQKCLTY